MEYTTVTIIEQRTVCDGVDVDVSIDSLPHTFHFSKNKPFPENLQARVEELVGLLPDPNYMPEGEE